MRTVQSQVSRQVPVATRVPPTRPRTAPQSRGVTRPKLGLMQKVARALGLSEPSRPQPKVGVDRFHRDGTYDHVARTNISHLVSGRRETANTKPTTEILVSYLDSVIAAEKNS